MSLDSEASGVSAAATSNAKVTEAVTLEMIYAKLQQLDTRLQRLESFEDGIERLDSELAAIHEHSTAMVRHISMVERVWSRVRSPLFAVVNVAERLAGALGQSSSQIENSDIAALCGDGDICPPSATFC